VGKTFPVFIRENAHTVLIWWREYVMADKPQTTPSMDRQINQRALDVSRNIIKHVQDVMRDAAPGAEISYQSCHKLVKGELYWAYLAGEENAKG
jgi:hypothetical protein